MKAEILSILVSGLWIFLGRYFPKLIILLSWAFYPALFLLSEIFIQYEINNYLIVLFSFVLIFVSDYIIRNIWKKCEDFDDQCFYITLITSTIILLIITFIRLNQNSIIQGIYVTNAQIFTSAFYVLVLALTTNMLFHYAENRKEQQKQQERNKR